MLFFDKVLVSVKYNLNFCFTCTYTFRAFFSIDPDPDFVPIRIRTQEKSPLDPDKWPRIRNTSNTEPGAVPLPGNS